VLLSRTGGLADIGIAGARGFELAMKELASKWKTSNYRVQFIYEDAGSGPDTAAIATNKLIRGDKVDVIIGDLTSTTTLAAAPIAQSAKVPLLSPSSTSDKTTQVGNYVFRACLVDSVQAIAMANYAFDRLKIKEVAVLVDMDMDHSRDVSKVFIKEFEKRGGKILKVVRFRGNHDTSNVAQLTELRNLHPQAIYAPVYYAKMGAIFKQARTFGIQAQFLGDDAWDSPLLFDLAAGTTEGGLFTNTFSYLNPSQKVQKFRANFKGSYGVEPSAYSALAYDSIFVLENALSRIVFPMKKSFSESIRDGLATTKRIEGVTGEISLDRDRNAPKPDIVILQLKKDGYKFHGTYINQ